jgi:hypothetical protein
LVLGRRVALALALLPVAVVAVAAAAPRGSRVVTIAPPVVQLHQAARVSVGGVAGAVAVEVRLRGASMPSGTPLPWTHLQLAHGVWTGRLGEPAFRGIYPVELRTRPGVAQFVADSWVLRVLPPGTLDRPAFTTPESVVQWWVAEVAHGSLASFRPWPLLAYDRRDPRLHRLFVVAYDPPGATDASGRLGVWITAFRDGYRGLWRFLEATVRP